MNFSLLQILSVVKRMSRTYHMVHKLAVVMLECNRGCLSLFYFSVDLESQRLGSLWRSVLQVNDRLPRGTTSYRFILRGSYISFSGN